MNRQTKRQMAKQGTDKPRAPEQRPRSRRTRRPSAPARRSTSREVQGEMKKVAWPPRTEIINSTIVVLIGVVVMTALIFGFD